MTIRFISAWNVYPIDAIVTLSGSEETRLTGLGIATFDLDLGANKINESRAALSSDSGLDPLRDTASSPITYTLNSSITSAVRIRQDSAGAVTVQNDGSAQMIGAGGSVITSLATTGIGSMILIEPLDLTVTPKKYVVIKGGA